MELKTFIATLKYSGVVLAALSTVWGLTHELYIKDESGRRKLTGPGKAAIAIVLLSLLISLNTAVLENILKGRDEQRAQDAAKLSRVEQQQRDLAQLQRDEALKEQNRYESRLQQEKIDAAKRDTILDAAERERREISRLAGIVEKQEATIFDVNRTLNLLNPIAFAAEFTYSTDDEFIAASIKRIRSYVETWTRSNYPQTQSDTLLLFGKGDLRNFDNIEEIVLRNKTGTHFLSSTQPIPEIGPLVLDQLPLMRIEIFKNEDISHYSRTSLDPDLSYDVFAYDIKDLEEFALKLPNSKTLPESAIVMTMNLYPRRQSVQLKVASRAVITENRTGKIVSLLDLPRSSIVVQFPGIGLTSGQVDRRARLEKFVILLGADYGREIEFEGHTFKKLTNQQNWPSYFRIIQTGDIGSRK